MGACTEIEQDIERSLPLIAKPYADPGGRRMPCMKVVRSVQENPSQVGRRPVSFGPTGRAGDGTVESFPRDGHYGGGGYPIDPKNLDLRAAFQDRHPPLAEEFLDSPQR